MRYSVIVPVYRIEPFIRRCVDSILGQTFGDFELLLVDDGSPDACPAICDAYAAADRRVRVIHKPNGGLVSARKAGVLAAEGEYLCYVDGDDWVSERWLAALEEKMAACPAEPDMAVFGSVKVFEDRTEEIRITVPDGFYDKTRLEREVYPVLISDRRRYPGCSCLTPYAWNKIYRRELLRAHYCKNEKITRGEDNAFSLECAAYAGSILVFHDVLYFYNKLNAVSKSTKYTENILHSYAQTFQYQRDHLSGLCPSFDRQLNDTFIERIAFGMVRELEHRPAIREAAPVMARQLRETGILRFVTGRGLTLPAKALYCLLKLHCYRLALLGCKLRMKTKAA